QHHRAAGQCGELRSHIGPALSAGPGGFAGHVPAGDDRLPADRLSLRDVHRSAAETLAADPAVPGDPAVLDQFAGPYLRAAIYPRQQRIDQQPAVEPRADRETAATAVHQICGGAWPELHPLAFYGAAIVFRS